jgi:FMN phosphatase YigB (HAD superfamily)
VAPGRALHIGDDDVDEEAARAAGMAYAPTPAAGVVAELA